VLVVGLTFADTALPQLLGAEEESGLSADQMRLTDFGVSQKRSLWDRVRRGEASVRDRI
jgi:hypothetical protein